MKINSIGIIGYGVVGSAIDHYFSTNNIPVYIYDKFKSPWKKTFSNLLKTDLIFVSIPSNYDDDLQNFDLSNFYEILEILNNNNYNKAILFKSTLLPGTCEKFNIDYPKLNIIYNPEFLSEKTAVKDYANPKQIILGCTPFLNHKIRDSVGIFFNKIFFGVDIEIVSSTEAECTKIFLNSFYSVKVQFFNELYSLTDKIGVNYNSVIPLMLGQGWIDPQHTRVPGPDGYYSYGGKCLPKDSRSLLALMKRYNTYHKILKSTIEENKIIRPENYI